MHVRSTSLHLRRKFDTDLGLDIVTIKIRSEEEMHFLPFQSVEDAEEHKGQNNKGSQRTQGHEEGQIGMICDEKIGNDRTVES